ncbi:MAG TPA: glycosyltransferase family 2 protein [Coriobacteriia bacterium]
MSVVALIPAHDEAVHILATVRAASADPRVDRVVVIDDGSTDETGTLAAAAGAEVLRLDTNLGKGGALDAGLALVAPDADILVLLDGDLGETASQAGRLLTPVLAGDADMAVATFPTPSSKAGFGLVKGLARAGIRALAGPAGRAFAATAPLSGQRVLTRRAVETVAPFAFGYGVEVATTVRALRAGLRVVEIPTTMTHDATGRDAAGFAHRGRQFAHVASALVRLAFERKRNVTG